MSAGELARQKQIEEEEEEEEEESSMFIVANMKRNDFTVLHPWSCVQVCASRPIGSESASLSTLKLKRCYKKETNRSEPTGCGISTLSQFFVVSYKCI